MKIGFMLPAFGAMATHENMLAMSRLAEDRGFESVWVPDHVIMPTKINTPYPYSKSGRYIADPKGAHLEPFTVLSFVAACTRRVRLGFTVIVAPYRHPVVTGKMLASLDVLSNGRLIVGVGAVGWKRSSRPWRFRLPNAGRAPTSIFKSGKNSGPRRSRALRANTTGLRMFSAGLSRSKSRTRRLRSAGAGGPACAGW